MIQEGNPYLRQIEQNVRGPHCPQELIPLIQDFQAVWGNMIAPNVLHVPYTEFVFPKIEELILRNKGT